MRIVEGIKIESGIEPQGKVTKRKWLTILLKMKVGESFEVEDEDEANKVRCSAQSTRHKRYNKSNSVKRVYIKTEKQKNGRVRIWRIENA